MERLQTAIQKARMQRAGSGPEQYAPAHAPSARAGLSDPRPRPGLEERWQALQPLELNKTKLVRNRIVALQADVSSAPFDVMRTRLLQQARKNNWRRIAIVSAHEASGKTTVTTNLAFGLARHRGIRTVVVDLDLRRYGLSHLFDRATPPSVVDVLEERVPFADVARRHGSSLAFCIGATPTPNAGEILLSDQTQTVLKTMEADYEPDVVLFDLPPLNVGDDTQGFLTRVDAALILAEAEKSTVAQIDVAERQVAELTNVMGIVLNKSRYVSDTYSQQEYYY
ncbi:MAG: exopolysaccharide biosynthesis protein [Rhodobacteraceae bacterium]|nr:exopolysaccharide biosynthesis protein [Paracoccaceae bacterium]MAY47688.1 exopolysaccharide biosynthesis protein [Paracoccaceae bacterium]